jgi:phosphatidylserine/phosphatidylglycerophosphate/cardiolipin synthase-like enzyme
VTVLPVPRALITALAATVLSGLVATALVVASLLAVPASVASTAPPRAARVGAYVPPAGANFNNPIGTPVQQRKLLQQVIRTTNSAPPGSTIRMAVYSFGDGQTADALLAAHARGVNVKLVFAGENVYPAMARLRDGIGQDVSQPSFVVICKNSCRGDKGQMHAKYFSFTQAGSARWITMVGSVNLTQYNAQDQWNDLYTRVDDRPYFRAYGRWFGQLKEDQPVAKQYLHKATATTDIRITPVDLKTEADPVLDALGRVRCEVTRREIDPGSKAPDEVVKTDLYVNTHAWNEERGKRIAWKVVDLRSDGCRVKVFYGTGLGAAVRSILENNGVRIRKGHHQGVRTHQKVMIVDGAFGDDLDTVRAWTGSQNWSDRAANRDDLIVQINDPGEAQRYVDRFLWMWDHA